MKQTKIKRDKKELFRKALEHQEEWDFRTLTDEDELHLVIRYEYARSTPWLVKAFERWHNQRLELPERCEGFKKWNGCKVEKVLNYVEALNCDKVPKKKLCLPFEVSSGLFATQPEYFEGSPYADLTDISIHFPKPYLSLSTRFPSNNTKHKKQSLGQIRHLLPRSKHQRCGFTIVKSIPKVSRRQFRINYLEGIVYLAVKLDFRVGKTQLRADAIKSLVRYYNEYPRIIPIPKGSAAAPPWHYLKELAAYRLRQFGLDGEMASEMISDLKAMKQGDDVHLVLPCYESIGGGWFNATKNADERIRQMYPSPYKLLNNSE